MAQGLVEGSPRTISAIGQALTASRNYAANQLIELLGREVAPKVS